MTNPYEHAFPARQETPEGEPKCATCGLRKSSTIHHGPPYEASAGCRGHGADCHEFRSQASPVGEAPRETGVWRCPCGEYETTVLHEDGEARIVSRRPEARQTPSREETAEAYMNPDPFAADVFAPPAEAACATCGKVEDEHCGDDPRFCSMAHPFVPRTSEEPTEHLSVGWSTATSEAAEGEWRREPLQTGTSRSFVSWTAPDGDVTVIREDLEQAIARQAAAPLGTRVSELERALAEADRWLELIRAVTAPKSGYIDAAERAYSLVNDALARPRSTESAPEEGSDE